MRERPKGNLALTLAAVAVLVGAALTAWLVYALASEADAPTQSVAPSTVVTAERATTEEGVTLVLHATGTTGTLVTYTCVEGGEVSVCQEPVNGLWVKKITVPLGTVVMVQARGGIVPSDCSITDESDRMVLNGNRDVGECVWMVE